MKTLKTLMIVFLFGVVVLGIIAFTTSGCSTSKPTEPEATSDPEPIAPKLPVALSEEEAREKAKKIVREMWWKEQQLNYRTLAADYWSSFDMQEWRNPNLSYNRSDLIDVPQTMYDTIRFNKSGFTSDQIAVLQIIHKEENPDERPENGSSFFPSRIHNFIGVYLKLSFQYPEKTEPELLELFREAARNGETHIKLVSWSEEDALEKAVGIIKEVYIEHRRLVKKWEKEPRLTPFFHNQWDMIEFEKTGVWNQLAKDLLDMHFDENPQDKRENRGPEAEVLYDGLIIVWLQILFQYPEITEEEQLKLFNEAVKNGKTHVRAKVVERVYGIKRYPEIIGIQIIGG